MKHLRPNIVIVAPTDTTPGNEDPQTLARALAQEGWVYFAELNREDIEDDEHGVRFVNWQDSLVDHFGALEAVVVIDDRPLARKLSERRADVPVVHWGRGKILSENDSSSKPGPSLVECFNRASRVLPAIERCAFSQASTAA